MGRLVADPELRTTTKGTNVCRFRLACDRSFVRQGEQRQADFLDVVAWRQTAEFVSKYFQKGSLIAIEGSLQTRQYQDKNGNNRTAVEVLADNVSFCGSRSTGAPASFEQQTARQVHQAKASQPQQMDFSTQNQRSQWQPPQAPSPAPEAPAEDFSLISDDGDLPF
jgi:single-strand DNA-binding protein